VRLGFDSSFSCGGLSPTCGDGGPAGGLACERLPDSEEYIARLEVKLGRLRAGLSRQQQHHKEDIIAALLTSDSRQVLLHGLGNEDLALEEAVETSQLVRQVIPQQPVTRGETVPLVTADQLDRSDEQQDGQQL
jgi:hypothetical protein